MIVHLTPDREERVRAWKAAERTAVSEAFGSDVWPRVEEFIDSIPWLSDVDEALAAAGDSLFRPVGQNLTPEESARDVAGRRTLSTLTRDELTSAMAARMGVDFEHMSAWRAKVERDFDFVAEEGSRTALYRYFDADGKLLYVGITDQPEARDRQHRRNAKWYGLAVDRRVEWFDTRAEADGAERTAIRAESPLFNDVHNRANRAAALDYLLERVVVGGAS